MLPVDWQIFSILLDGKGRIFPRFPSLVTSPVDILSCPRMIGSPLKPPCRMEHNNNLQSPLGHTCYTCYQYIYSTVRLNCQNYPRQEKWWALMHCFLSAWMSKFLQILYLLENKHLRLFSKRDPSQAIIFQWVLIFEQTTPKKAYLRFYKAHKNGSPIEIYSILQGISIGAYFPIQGDCKPHMRLFFMGA